MRAVLMRFAFACLAWAFALTTCAHAADAASTVINFTAQEKSYLEKTKSITMCVDPDWVPFERINAQGEHEGIAADLVQLVAQRIGLKIELLPVTSWDESLADSKAGRCQIISFLNQTTAREQWLSFTQPIFYDQNIIITREEHPFIGDPKSLSDETIVLPRGTMIEERIRQDFPNLKVITTSSEAEAMSFVSERKADMTVRSLIVAASEIKKEGLFNLKISGQIPDYANKLRIGVLKSEPVLRDILDKGVKTITVQEREAITNKHVAINVQQGGDDSLIWKIIVVGSMALLIVLYWNRKFKAMNRELARLSVIDTLTGLPNRNKTDEVLDRELHRSLRFNQPFSVIMIDIDKFKQVNDKHVLQVGNQVLIEVAKLLKAHTRETDFIGRRGDDGFLVISTQTDLAGAVKLAENLRQAIEREENLVIRQKTASFGVATYRLSDQPKDILARADAALYDAKRQGGQPSEGNIRILYWRV